MLIKKLENLNLKLKRHNRRNKDYLKSLSDQINYNNKKKSKLLLMTDHERRVNENDIKAYENIDK